ncbi:hypothetical protein [Microbulbifer pacificus]|uniref:hypothetical protein n=1 Tax=Microbulbifer pacificus TaxID=407164 RepID=UPI000CF497F3|nr:hypothetical protein [Microbulbifer pacificus]
MPGRHRSRGKVDCRHPVTGAITEDGTNEGGDGMASLTGDSTAPLNQFANGLVNACFTEPLRETGRDQEDFGAS